MRVLSELFQRMSHSFGVHLVQRFYQQSHSLILLHVLGNILDICMVLDAVESVLEGLRHNLRKD